MPFVLACSTGRLPSAGCWQLKPTLGPLQALAPLTRPACGALDSPQGRGIGRRLLRALLALWDDEHGGGLVLATQEAHALRLYRAHGFTEPEGAAEAEEAGPAAASADCSGAGSTATAGTPAEGTGPSPEAVPAYKSWVLVRPAQPPAGAASSEQ